MAANLLARRKAEASLYRFTEQAWEISEGVGRVFIPNWHIEAVAEHLEAQFRAEIRNLLINIPPRTLKSGLAAVMLPPWVWIRDPSMQFLYVSYAQDLSMRDSRKSRLVIESQWYQRRWGDRYQITSDQNTKIRFDNDKGGYRLCSAVDAKITGEGGDWLVCDDPNNVRDRSEVMLQSTLDWWHEVMPTRLNDFKKGRRTVIQQRMDQRDISGEIITKDEGEWVKLILPMEYEPRRHCVTVKLPSTGERKWDDPRRVEGELLFPARIGERELRILKRDLGSEFAISGQLQQSPIPVGGGLIKRHWFKLWTSEAPPKCEFTLTSIDTAITESKRSAWNVATTWGVFRRAVEGSISTNPASSVQVPNVVLLSMWRMQCGYEVTRQMVQRLALDYLDDQWDKPRHSKRPLKPDVILVEAKATGHVLIADLMRTGISVWPYNPDRRGDKLQRVHLVTPILAAHRVWLPGKPPDYYEPREWCEPFMAEMLAFPNGTYRDIVDTMSQALDHLQRFNWLPHPDDWIPEEKPRDWAAEREDEPLFYG